MGTRLKEHRKEVEKTEQNRTFTRSEKEKGEKTVHKPALADHTNTTNHLINWKWAIVITREAQWKADKSRKLSGSGEHLRTGTEPLTCLIAMTAFSAQHHAQVKATITVSLKKVSER